MATGLQGSENSNVNRIVLIEGATAANAVAVGTSATTLSETPTTAQYYDLRAYRALYGSIPDEALLVIRSTAGSGTMTLGACRVMVSTGAVGGPLGIGTDAAKGGINNGAAFVEDAANHIYHREVIAGLSMVDGVQVQLGTIAGTSTAINVELHFPLYRKEA
jgi:hypothetical protein